MEINDAVYGCYATVKIKDIPLEKVQYLINMLLKDAARDMGTELKDETIDRAIYIARTDFKHIPLCYIASAFMRGALGTLGAGRLIPRTLYAWFGEASSDYFRAVDKEKQVERSREERSTFDLHKYPVGSAIMKKIEWYNNGSLNMEDWEKVPLKELAEKIKQGVFVTPALFLNSKL